MTTEADDASGKLAGGTSTLDLALRVLDFLVGESRPQALAQIAAALGASKSTVYRHLVTLGRHGLVRQDQQTDRYEPAVKLVVWGEAVRARFDVMTAARDVMVRLRDETAQAVTLCGPMDGGGVVVLELIQGRTVIEFGTRPGTRLDYHASAHGRVWLAFGAAARREAALAGPLRQWTQHTLTDPAALRREIEAIRARGWATAPDEIVIAVNALAAPVFDHRGEQVGSLAIAGPTQFIPSPPTEAQIRAVLAAAQDISRQLGWSAKP